VSLVHVYGFHHVPQGILGETIKLLWVQLLAEGCGAYSVNK
jgi:hypothetical protein